MLRARGRPVHLPEVKQHKLCNTPMSSHVAQTSRKRQVKAVDSKREAEFVFPKREAEFVFPFFRDFPLNLPARPSCSDQSVDR